MANVNRDQHVSEQKEVIYYRGFSNILTGQTVEVSGPLPYPCTIQSMRAYCIGVSNAMQIAPQVSRFTSGGLTTISLGISNLICVAAGTSGVQGYSGFAVPGSTLLSLQAGDVIQITTSVANAAVNNIALNFVIQKVQDIVSMNGVIA